MKKLRIYYGCHIVVNIALLIIFSAYIELHLLSVLPVALIVLQGLGCVLTFPGGRRLCFLLHLQPLHSPGAQNPKLVSG